MIDTVRVGCVKVNCNAATCINEKIVGISAFTTGRPEAEQDGDENDEPDGDGEWAGSVGAEPIGVVAERTGRMLLKTLHEAGGVVELSAAHEAVSAHHGNKAQCLCSYAQGQSRIADRIDQLSLVSRESARARSSSVGWV
ncbi:MAG TPA: hypothetical protein VIY28_09715 [Pseudonocardiaceae bacterium]